MLENYNFKRCERSSLLKEMLQKEFGQSIGFHNRFQKNKSCIVFDVSKGYTYVEAAINFWSISEDDMLTLLPLGFFGVRIPGGRGTKCSPLYNSRTKYGNLMKLCRPIVWSFVHIWKKSLLWPHPLWRHTCSFFWGTTSKNDYFLKKLAYHRFFLKKY